MSKRQLRYTLAYYLQYDDTNKRAGRCLVSPDVRSKHYRYQQLLPLSPILLSAPVQGPQMALHHFQFFHLEIPKDVDWILQRVVLI